MIYMVDNKKVSEELEARMLVYGAEDHKIYTAEEYRMLRTLKEK